jgi:2-keto-4-pentenoate hydratase
MTPSPSHVEGLDEGMRALLKTRDRDLAGGATAVGWKVGLNGAMVQQLFGLDGLVVGALTDATIVAAGTDVDVSEWTHPALEVEIAVRIGEDGGIAAVAPALELVDLNLPFDRLEPILAGNLFHRGVIFGPEVAPFDLNGLAVAVHRDDEELANGALEDPLEDTVESVRSFLATYGAELAPGHRIIAGSIIPPLAMTAGDCVKVDFGPLGELKVGFASQ